MKKEARPRAFFFCAAAVASLYDLHAIPVGNLAA
jgi:hypothetical protein